MALRRALPAMLFSVVLLAPAMLAAADKLSDLQTQFDRETSAVHKAKLLDKLGDAQFAAARDAGKSGDYTAVDTAMEKYRDNVAAVFGALKKQHPDAERHPNGYKQLEMSVRKGIREVDDTLLVAPLEYRPPLELVRKDLIATGDELLRLLFPRRTGDAPHAPPKEAPPAQPPAEKKP